MTQKESRLADYMPTNPQGLKNIASMLGASTKWDMEHTDILDKTVIIHSVTACKHASKDAAICEIEYDGHRKLCLFASSVLAKQLIQVQDELPLVAKVVKKGKRYHFTV